MIQLNWVPTKSLGPFEIGSSLKKAKLITSFKRIESPTDNFLKLFTYLSKDERVRLEIRNNMIESVSSEVQFIINNKNIIGINIQEAENYIGSYFDESDDLSGLETGMKLVDFSNLGLQLLLKKNEIVSATCY